MSIPEILPTPFLSSILVRSLVVGLLTALCAALLVWLLWLCNGSVWNSRPVRLGVLTAYAGCIVALMLPAIVTRWQAAFRGAARDPKEVRKARSSVSIHLAIAVFHALGFLSGLLLFFLPQA